MTFPSSPTILDLAGHGIKVWFWGSVKDSKVLKSIMERISGVEVVDKNFDEALRDSLNFATHFLREKKALSDRSINVLDKTIKFLMADKEEITNGIEGVGLSIFGDLFMMSPHVQAAVEAGAESIAGKTSAIRRAMEHEVKNPGDPDQFKKILSTYNFYYPNGLKEFEKRVLKHDGWTHAERHVLSKIFDILRKEVMAETYIQSQKKNEKIKEEDSKKWEARMGVLNEVLTKENPDIEKHLTAALPLYQRAAIKAVQAIPSVVNTIKNGVDALQRGANAIKSAGSSLDSNSIVNAVSQLSMQAVKSIAASNDAAAPALVGYPATNGIVLAERVQIVADALPEYSPLGNRTEVVMEHSQLTGATQAANIHNHAHAESRELEERMVEACNSALSEVGQTLRPLYFVGEDLLSAAFLEQQEGMLINFPNTSGEAQSYYDSAWNMGKAGWNYGMSWLGYQESPAEQQLRQRVQGLDHACRGNKELMQEASHYLDQAFAEACLLEPLSDLRVDGEKNLLRFPTGSNECLLRTHPNGPRYTYTIERKGDDATALTIEASWEIQEYGESATNLKPQGTSSSALRTSVQLILRAADDGAGIETSIHPLGLSASIDNRIVYGTNASA
ncbi:hypothetical protein [Noviherbaspirillum pedocola]|uniref:Uncharacterized protein n=1 Tax=Noviherbaspirillum pedocola TaxID=2801341 RepID=A0A934W622_9BURK|nr:hypothetical protein [Noviherbaspirillum pedocola]MBK4734605.1 hypothetical protein [Noviherbaspirillum pedocola]